MTTPLSIDPRRTALVLIDLQRGILGMPVAPHSGPEVVARAVRLTETFRKAGALVVLVHVAFSADGKDMLQPEADNTPQRPAWPANWTEFVPEIGPREGDLVITKRQWGAFHGTELDLQLRRRNIGTIVLGGISTNIGVESTARGAFERGYQQIFAEDAMASFSEEAHKFATSQILPRIGRVRSTDEIVAAFPAAGA